MLGLLRSRACDLDDVSLGLKHFTRREDDLTIRMLQFNCQHLRGPREDIGIGDVSRALLSLEGREIQLAVSEHGLVLSDALQHLGCLDKIVERRGLIASQLRSYFAAQAVRLSAGKPFGL